MKAPQTSLYAKWVNTGWMVLTGRPTELPAKEAAPKAAQAAADQEWEDEGGSVKPAQKPGTEKKGTEPAPKIPF
jgi:hypothetical protein